ncbi:ATP-binding cassette domain-containing protein [Myceligenerans indicum]|uniref:ATP-binding cassette domain-containing protein n=1 Tax=Myceligenerans indicum TaxID=2593663 RepID=A0ABS1LLP7_9MICO|nr:ATP-binding cassette domain-containing protein [Myceligenerans indicum]MBL0887172.1 ATP-binding cassette domain-containing protein [Myceligenerans indicum]
MRVIPLAVALAGADAWLAVVTGRLVAEPSPAGLLLFATLTVATIAGNVVATGMWRAAAARGESRLREQLLDATLHRTLPDLEEQPVGTLLERTDDDPRALFDAFRRLGEVAFAALVGAVVAWVTAGVTWRPAWIVFPAVGALGLLLVRGTGGRITAATTEAEKAWADSSGQLEESVAARDDMRTSGGQPFVLRRFARAGAAAIRAQVTASMLSAGFSLRLSLVMAGLTTAVVIGGVWTVQQGSGFAVAQFVTLFLLVGMFVRRFRTLTTLLPEVQEGLGTLARVRQMLEAPREPASGQHLDQDTDADVLVEFQNLTFTYESETGAGFTLGPIDLTIPAGQTLALVGRTGSGKTTLAKTLSRAIEPPPGTVRLDGADVTGLDVEDLRGVVGVVGQRTEILAGTLRQNITLFGKVPDDRVDAALGALDLTEWARSLPDGLDTLLGPHGVTLSAGEQQLVAFARLLVRDVRMVVLDEATARMDPATSRTVTRAARRLLAGRTGIIVAHRLDTARFAETVAVMDHGRIAEHGPWEELSNLDDGRLARLLTAAGTADEPGPATSDEPRGPGRLRRHRDETPRHDEQPDGVRVRLARTATRAALARPRWWVRAEGALWVDDVLGADSAAAGWVWAALVAALVAGNDPWWPVAGVLGAAVLSAVAGYRWTRPGTQHWAEGRLRVRLAILRGQTGPDPVKRPSPGEVTARTLEEHRLLVFSRMNREFLLSLTTLAFLGGITGSPLAIALALAVVAVSAAAAAAGSRIVGDTARLAGDARAEFGRALGSVLEAVRTIKLSGRTRPALAHLQAADAVRVDAKQREDRTSYLVWQAPWLISKSATIAVWWLHVADVWDLRTTLVVYTAIGAYGWAGATAGNLITRIPIARRWLTVATGMAGTDNVATVHPDTDLVGGTHQPTASQTVHDPGPLRQLRLDHATAVHDDGTTGVRDVSLQIQRGQTVMIIGPVASGKSSLLAGLAGLVHLEGTITWNNEQLTSTTGLAGVRIAHVAQVPRLVSGTITENVHLDHDRDVAPALASAQLSTDVQQAGGPETLVGHRGLRLSGGQTQRMALARALAVNADLLLIDDVSSALDATTEAAVRNTLRQTGTTIIGTSSRHATLAAADQVIVLDDGRHVDAGTWSELRGRWGHLAG